MPATDSFTSAAAVVTTGAATFSDPAVGSALYTLRGGWAIRVTPRGVTISKASSFGGSQSAIPWPVSLDDARELAQNLIKAVT
jgi:hypothetical protein